jgi:hypothetical protein
MIFAFTSVVLSLITFSLSIALIRPYFNLLWKTPSAREVFQAYRWYRYLCQTSEVGSKLVGNSGIRALDGSRSLFNLLECSNEKIASTSLVVLEARSGLAGYLSSVIDC